MKSAVIPFALLLLTVTNACAQPKSAWTSDLIEDESSIKWVRVPLMSSEGQLIPSKTMHEGGSGSKSQIYASFLFMGSTDRKPGSMLYAFLATNEGDKEKVNDFLVTHKPSAWKELPKDSPWRTKMKPREDFVEVPVTDDGTFILVLDELSNPGCSKLTSMTITDGAGVVLDRIVRK